MGDINIPWGFSHLKAMVGYRRWEAIKALKGDTKRRAVLAGYESGKKVLFIHIPKTAGVSLIRAYNEYFADARHSTALMYKVLLGAQFNAYSTFAVVRNPWARLFSAYNFLRKGGLIPSDSVMGEVLSQQCPSFEIFVKEWLPKYGVCSYMHFVPQHEFVCGWTRDIIIDHVIKLERLSEEWPALAAKLGVPVREIGRANAGLSHDYRTSFDNESIEIVGRLYKHDVGLFGYSFE